MISSRIVCPRFLTLSSVDVDLDELPAIERTVGWQGLEEMVEAMDQNLGGTRADSLAEVIESYARVHRTATIILGAFTFRSWKSTDPLLNALRCCVSSTLPGSGGSQQGYRPSFWRRRGAS